MILTTEHHGTIHAPGHPFWHMANASRNAIRLADWRDRLHRSGTGRASSDAAVCARPSGWALFCRAVSVTAQAIGLLILAALLFFWVAVADALVNQPEPAEPECVYQWTADARFVDTCEVGE